ncbi:MAG: AmpG family muropeptide MFS transporter [Archangium sp.]|nr:AmpG family muropeptide MFS transporter [Archangium sp.]
MAEASAKPKVSVLRLFTSRRMFMVVLSGFSSGLPLSLTASTMQAWMKDSGVDLTTIGAFALVGIPYSLKFLWAPVLDRYTLPFLGRRRGWILVTQIFLAAAIAAMGLVDPKEHLGLLALLALCVAFGSASQDVVIDAWRTETLTVDEYGAGAAAQTIGYRGAMLVSGAVALALADTLPWRTVYLMMAGVMTLSIAYTLFAAEPKVAARPPRTLTEAAVFPLVEFLKRKGSIENLAFIILYKLDVVMALALTTPFLQELGFTKTVIAGVNKGGGLAAVILGTVAGGALLPKLGMKKALWAFGVLQGIATLSFLALSIVGKNYALMVFAICADNFFSGMGTAAYAAFLMSLCNPKFTATQFALLSSLMALTRTVAGAPTGWLAEHLGWPTYFVVCTLAMIPGLLLLTRFDRWKGPELEPVVQEEPGQAGR